MKYRSDVAKMTDLSDETQVLIPPEKKNGGVDDIVSVPSDGSGINSHFLEKWRLKKHHQTIFRTVCGSLFC